MNKRDECRELVRILEDQFPENDRLNLILASLLFKEKKFVKSEELLKNYAIAHPENSLLIQLSLSQFQLNKGNIPLCISLLESITNLKYKPGMVGTLIALREQIGEIDKAIQTFDEYVTWLSQQTDVDQDIYIQILKKKMHILN